MRGRGDRKHLLVDVAGAESERWRSAVGVVPIVVGESDVEVPLVLGAIVVGMAYEGSLVLNKPSLAKATAYAAGGLTWSWM